MGTYVEFREHRNDNLIAVSESMTALPREGEPIQVGGTRYQVRKVVWDMQIRPQPTGIKNRTIDFCDPRVAIVLQKSWFD